MTQNNKIKVYLADDHNVVRKGMIRLLGTFERVSEVKEASNGKELLKLMEGQTPDVVIIDVEMPVMGGVEAGKQISNLFPNVKILILTMHTEEVFINKMMDIGVHGFLSKSAEVDELEKALYSVVDRDFYKNKIVERAIVKSTYNESKAKYSKLTTREIEILLLICQEYTPSEISQRLCISEKTFFNHRTNIVSKTGSRNNIGLYKYAIQRGYFST
jgi:two-component system, NarL family, response regulator DegU